MRKCLVPNVPAELKYGAAISQARQVTGLEVELGEDGEAVVLYLDDSNRAGTPLACILSPPAAAQLSDCLAEAVQRYLYGPQQDDQTPEDQG